MSPRGSVRLVPAATDWEREVPGGEGRIPEGEIDWPDTTPAREVDEMFVWVFHRVSGLLLIFLLSLQLLTGFFQASSSNSDLVVMMAGLHHQHATLNCLMVFLLVFHSLYGIRTILMDLGLGREKLLFWCSSALGLVIFVVFLVLYATLV
jgi:succinate dehydrogenase cytochrome b556 subunit